MAVPLKDLLGKAVDRAHIAKGVAGARVIEEANRFLATNLPPGRVGDAKAISFRQGALVIGCLNGAVANFVGQRQDRLMASLKQTLPDCAVERVITKIMGEFPERDFMVK